MILVMKHAVSVLLDQIEMGNKFIHVKYITLECGALILTIFL